MSRTFFAICVILHRKEEHFEEGLGVVVLLENLYFIVVCLKPLMKGEQACHQSSNNNICLPQYRSWQTIVSLLVFYIEYACT
jgi:hypothetical protein